MEWNASKGLLGCQILEFVNLAIYFIENETAKPKEHLLMNELSRFLTQKIQCII